MNVTPDKHWESALALIAQSVSQQQFDTWFKPIVFESFNNDTKLLVLRVPSSYVYEYIEEHYIDLLSRVLFSAFGQRIRLTYRVVVDSEHKKTQDIEADRARLAFLLPTIPIAISSIPCLFMGRRDVVKPTW